MMSIRSKMRVLVVATCGCLLTTHAVNASTSIAYINASGGSVDYLTGYGYSITYLNNPTGLTATSLSGYSAVLVASNSIFSEPSTVGDALAGFADAGGGVVLGEFCFQGLHALNGGIMTAGYSPFTRDPLNSGYSISSSLGTVYESGHPLLAGATGADTSFQANVGLDSGATLVADWTSGRHAIAYNSLVSSSVVAVNMFPKSDYANSYDQQLWANALEYSMSAHGGGNQTVPVPGAVALLSLGLGLTGRVRRRQTA